MRIYPSTPINMKLIIKLNLFMALLTVTSVAFAQADINTEVFTSHVTFNASGANVAYIGKGHSFTVDVIGTDVKEAPHGDVSQPNQNFVIVDKDIVQASLVPLPQPIADGVMLSKLTDEQIKPTLEGYVDYEIDYVKQLNASPTNIKKEWKTINSRLFLLWYFEFKPEGGSDVAVKMSAQVYLSTLCFNQVLDLNMPLADKKDYDKFEAQLEKIAATLKTYDKVLDVR